MDQKGKKVVNVLQWIVVSVIECIYVILLFSMLVTSSFISAAIVAALMILIFPPIYKKIPHFSGKMAVAVIVNIFLLMMAAWNLDTDSLTIDSTNSNKDTVTEVEEQQTVVKEIKTKPDFESESSEDKQEEISESVKDDANEISDFEEVTVKENEAEKSGKAYREYMDSLSLHDWMNENIEAGMHGEEYDYDGFKDRATDPVSEFYVQWANFVEEGITTTYNLENVNTNENPEYLDEYCDFLESALNLICEMYPGNAVLNQDYRSVMPIEVGREMAAYLHLHHDEYMESKEIVRSGHLYTPPFAQGKDVLRTYTSYYDGNEEYNEISYRFGEAWGTFQDFMAPEDETIREIRNMLLNEE